MIELPKRTALNHNPPPWIGADAMFFLTICCADRTQNHLANPVAFRVMTHAIEHYSQALKWHVIAFLAMPDHWHALVRFPAVTQMDKTMRDWKRYVAKQAGIRWQDGFFEHRLRSRQSAAEKWHYIRLNPVRKGLVMAPEDWPYAWNEDQTAR